MGLLKKIDEVFATARYYEALSQRYAQQLNAPATKANVVAPPAPQVDERRPIAA
jgi:hypothetical protein